jgi:Flp pilus assembly protein TadD
MTSSRRKILLVAGALALAAAVVALIATHSRRPVPPPALDDSRYEEYVESFETGTAALDVGRDDLALASLSRAIEMIPGEPAAWANRGLMFLRQNRAAETARDLNKAQELAPESPEIDSLLGSFAKEQGQFDQAVGYLRRAAERRPQDIAVQFALAQVVEQAAAADSGQEYQRLMDAILSVQPNNLKVLLERAKVAAQRRDAEAFNDSLKQFRRLATGWSPATRAQLQKVEQAAATTPGEIPFELSHLGNLLQMEAGYQRSATAVDPKPNAIGESLQQFLRLKPLRTVVDSPDTELSFSAATPKGIDADLSQQQWDFGLPVWLNGDGPPAVFVANAQTVRRVDGPAPILSFPAGSKSTPPTAAGVLAIDWNNDMLTDLLLAGSGGLAFWQQGDKGSFVDVTAKTGLDSAVIHGDYFGAWAADYDMDGDLDIIVAPRAGSPFVLRNNRDGTFKAMKPFADIGTARAFVWADFDNDGAPDAAFLDAEGRLHVFANERGGLFRQRTTPENVGRLLAFAAADVNDDGVFDLLALRGDGAILRISDREHGQGWQVVEIARWTGFPVGVEPGSARLLVADLDNNGMPDLIVSSPSAARIWLSEGPDKFTALASEIASPVYAAEWLGDQGQIDLLAISAQGQPLRLSARLTKNYHWQDVRPLAASSRTTGDDRINSFGIGGEMELRAGMLIQKMLIASPRVHFGLGHHSRGQVIRVVWPNGAPQVEFLNADKPVDADQVVLAQQRLKGSCPFLFTWNGMEVAFVTDFLWSSPLGMYINGQNQGSFAQTQDWVKVGGDQLVPRDGYYDVRVHANLWETHFIDYVALIAVDHPADTEVFVDERFALAPMTPQIHLTSAPKPVARAVDDQGTDVTEIVSRVDGRYLDTFGRGRFQGITRDHWVEVDLGDDAPRQGPFWLLATGWIHPTDSSINMAIGQGSHEALQPLTLEVPDGHGGWKVSGPPLGFPAGKNKTMMIRIDGLGKRFRLRTNMEIYWDALRYARDLDPKDIHQSRLAPETAELRFRGILDMTQANPSSPELPHYNRVTRSSQYWRDLIGYYTRFGDVRELLDAVDDRYAILNAGDEIALRFPVSGEPPAGWRRDFVWVADGWEKDGDFNTGFSKTVLPLPAHGSKSYGRAPGSLEDDPVYQRFPADWRNFHTRYVTPFDFEQGLRSFRRPQP